MTAIRPVTPDVLRAFLRDRLSAERLRRRAGADYGRDWQGISREFDRNLNTGMYGHDGDGTPCECAMLQRHSTTSDRPLIELFGVWWIGAFYSGAEHVVLINNLAPRGIDTLLHMVVRGCGELGPDTAAAPHAAIPFIVFVRAHAHEQRPRFQRGDVCIGSH